MLCNDSHGHATLAFLDDDFEFVGIVNSGNEFITDELDKYFKFKRPRDIDCTSVAKS